MIEAPAHNDAVPREVCCLPGAWSKVSIRDLMVHGEPLPREVADVAATTGLDPHLLDWHVEAVHGWEPHDDGYAMAVSSAAACLKDGGCETEK